MSYPRNNMGGWLDDLRTGAGNVIAGAHGASSIVAPVPTLAADWLTGSYEFSNYTKNPQNPVIQQPSTPGNGLLVLAAVGFVAWLWLRH